MFGPWRETRACRDETREPVTMAVIGVIFAWWLIRVMQARH